MSPVHQPPSFNSQFTVTQLLMLLQPLLPAIVFKGIGSEETIESPQWVLGHMSCYLSTRPLIWQQWIHMFPTLLEKWAHGGSLLHQYVLRAAASGFLHL